MRTTLKPTRTRAWLLLAALALATAGCSQLEDEATGNRPGTATGNEPMNISIAPKPAFEAGDAATRTIMAGDAHTRSSIEQDAHTRSTVDDATGKFEWTDGDLILVSLTFDDDQTNPTILYQKWVRSSTATTPIAGWNVYDNWLNDAATATALTTMNWPVGAKTCIVEAFYTNSDRNFAAGGNGFVDIKYNNGQGDHMKFYHKFNVGTPIDIVFARETTRLTIKGLKASTKYGLKVNDVPPTFPTTFKKENFALTDFKDLIFTTNAAGTTGDTIFTICLPLTPNATTGQADITLMKVNGDDLINATEINKATLQAKGSANNWDPMNGKQYIFNVEYYAGDTDPDTDGNLLPTPPPVVNGADVYEVNGYYVAKVANVWQWEVATGDTNPCKVAGNGWRLPTMKDFETLAGWGTTNPWNAISPNTGSKALGTITTAFVNAFSSTNYVYLSSDSKDDTSLWVLKLLSNGNASYAQSTKSSAYHYVRCVQRKP